MSYVRLISSSDEHLADLSPGFRKDDYRAAILGKLEYQGEVARKFEANAFLRGGDFFHIKPANKTTHATVAKASEIHKEYPCPTYALVGNHDMVYNDLETVPRQPLGVLYKSEVFLPLTETVFSAGSTSVRVLGVPYTSGLTIDQLRALVQKKRQDEYLVVFVHALAAMAPEERIQTFFNETIFDYRDLVFEGCPDVYIFGHYHKDQGIVEHMGVQFVNLGAISRGALTFENLDREPKICLMTFSSQGISLEEHVIPHLDAAHAFDLERKKKIDKERKSLDDFINNLKRDSSLANTDDVRVRFKKFDWGKFPDDLKSTVLEILEAAEAGMLDD